MAAADVSAALITAPVPLSDWLVALPLAIPVLAGAVLVLLRQQLKQPIIVAVAALLAMLVTDIALLARVLQQGPVVMYMGAWKPPFGIVFAADVFGTSLATLATFIALLATIYSAADVTWAERRFGFYPFLMLLMAGVTGAFLTGDIFNLYVWFEVLLISSTGLLLVGSKKPQIDGALKYGLLNLLATTLFLVATAYLYGVLGTLNMADIALKVRAAPADTPLVTIAVLYLVAFGMKAAAFPLNFWLPASYHAPGAGVSALFAAILTKVGIYALIKTEVLLLGPVSAHFAPVIAAVAGATMLTGALGALAQSELRRLFGWLVINGIGSMLMGLAIGGEAGLTAGIFYALHSMVTMAALYFCGGLVEALAGTDRLTQLGGVQKRAPLLGAVLLILSLAVAGLPPFSGFWPKVLLVKAGISAGSGGLVLVLLASSLVTTIAMGRVYLFAVWRDAPDAAAQTGANGPRSPGASVLLPTLVLTVLVVAIGLYPMPVHELAARSAAGLLNADAYSHAVLGGAP
ncbi:Na+/H+ antiporter subunit D [Oryzibacter oryziterrae]|uniref:Na+/H+ antiporter subunit D n=1 Tax=Oryzibacter oryziterrae TaxID=2766474 RepID=UPI001EFFCA05|nr:Na+/H+ antiporter subunit D [Oryzibacter oryziterrae]